MVLKKSLRNVLTKFLQDYTATSEAVRKNGQYISTNAKRKSKEAYEDLQSWSFLMSKTQKYICQTRFFSQLKLDEVFSDLSKQRFIKAAETMKILPFLHFKYSRDASVMVPLCRVNGEPSILFTMRSATVSRNKSDASFPGGMKEASDNSVVDVALRETQEEIGLLSKIDVWAVLPPMPSRSGKIKVVPVVAFLGDVDLKEYSVNKNEVDYIFSLSIASLCVSKNWFYTQFKVGYTLPVYVIGDHRVWGLTASILHYTLKALVPNNYTQCLPWECDKLQISSKN